MDGWVKEGWGSLWAFCTRGDVRKVSYQGRREGEGRRGLKKKKSKDVFIIFKCKKCCIPSIYY